LDLDDVWNSGHIFRAVPNFFFSEWNFFMECDSYGGCQLCDHFIIVTRNAFGENNELNSEDMKIYRYTD
jgi:hypothetical protein